MKRIKMLSNLLIHIGYHKTGTTWMQKEVFSKESKIFFPLSRKGKPKHMARFFIYGEEGFLLSPFRSNQEAAAREVEDILAHTSPGDRIPLISDERLSGNPHASGFDAKEIASRLNKTFPDARILIMVREQKSAGLSNYLQYLKVGGTQRLRTYLTREYDGKRPGFSPEHLRYTELISCYRTLFSPEKVLVLPYEMFKNEPAEFLTRLSDFLGKEIPVDPQAFTAYRNKHRTNLLTIWFPVLNYLSRKKGINNDSPFYIPGFGFLIRSLSRPFVMLIGKNRILNRMRRVIRDTLGDRYEKSNKQLSDLIGMDLSKYGYHP